MIPDWIPKIRKGDVLLTPSGRLRIVRQVKHRTHTHGPFKGQVRTSVCLAINHCSWTRRCYTVVNMTDLVQRGFMPTGMRVSLSGELDKEIERDINSKEKPKLDCCAVKGVA